jgi:hypothetical protein
MKSVFVSLRRRFNCAVRTNFMHELDVRSAKCRYCRREWARLYPPTNKLKRERPVPERSAAPSGVLGFIRAAWQRLVHPSRVA